MKNSITEYIKYVDDELEKKVDFKKLKDEHLIKIGFYQHERLIHLLVTLFYALFMLLTLILSFYNPLGIVIMFILMIILLFYVKHYFLLENSVQYMYKQYDKILEKTK